MHFTLYYDGSLPSAANDARVHEKQRIREALYPQFLTLWDTHPAFPPAPKGGGWSNWPEWQWSGGLVFPWHEKKSVFPRKCKSGEVKFVPLVRCEDKDKPYDSLFMLCELSVLFLRPGPRGGIIKSGDVDNRLLTLSDALCVPNEAQFNNLTTSHNLNDPFFCLLEDDSLISAWSVRTEQLLFVPPNTPDTYVRLIIDVFIKVTQAMVRTKSGGNRAVSPEFVITGLIFYPSRVES